MTVIGKFVPSVYDPISIAREMRAWLQARNIKPREPQIGVRTPADTINACESTPVLMEWHRDGAGPDPTDPNAKPSIQQILVWSNGTLTGIRDERGEFTANPYDVVVFNNVNAWHKSPPPEENRWFVSIYDPIINE